MSENLRKAIDNLFVAAAMDAMRMHEGELKLNAVIRIEGNSFQVTVDHEAEPQDEAHLEELAAQIRAGWK